MLDTVLRSFPAHTHPLTLVNDSDNILADSEVRGVLDERGFRLIECADPIELRVEVEHARPFTAVSPVIVVTPEPVNRLPYDLWQQGRHVQLALRDIFPHLDPSVVRILSARQRRRLSDGPLEQKSGAVVLTRRESIFYVLEHVFGLGLNRRITPAGLLRWMADYHASSDPLAPELAMDLLAYLRQQPHLSAWPLDTLLRDDAAFRRFAQDGWESYLRQHAAGSGRPLAEGAGAYSVDLPLPFGSDVALQDVVPQLVRMGVIRRVSAPDESALPYWTRIGVTGRTMEERLHTYEATLANLAARVQTAQMWEEWSDIALLWARLSLAYDDLRFQISPAQQARMEQTRNALDEQFLAWATHAYAPRAVQALPQPHHLFHVPRWLAAKRSRQPNKRTALLILDGMSLADWLLIWETWQAHHPDWVSDQLVALAEAPTITAISRLALVSGMRPNTMLADQLKNQYEERLWSAFWQQQGLSADAVAYAHLPARVGASYPNEIGSYRTQVICLVTTVVDEMVHGATQGAASVRASLEVWLRQRDPAQPGSAWIEGLIQQMLDEGYTVTITSDHGHVDAVGVGMRREGVLVSTRSKRARLYSSPDLAQRAHEHLPATMLLGEQWLPPEGAYPLVSEGRTAFAPLGERVVSHGGLSIEEMLVPLITLTKK